MSRAPTVYGREYNVDVRPVIDLRGDWAAPPTAEMRRAMANAEVGDDITGEDPTVNRLEAMAAEVLGKQAGLFVPSGSMGNLVAMLALAPWGSEILAGDQSHIAGAEQGGAAVVGGRSIRTLANGRMGTFDPAAIRAAIREDDIHYPRTGLLCLENTQNQCGGVPIDAATMAAQTEVAREMGIPVHLDGSRIWNAAVALGVPEAELAVHCTTVQACLSKGLAAPVGSILVGPADVIAVARRHRKLLGGGMRQAGVLAAAGILALTDMRAGLADDHRRARTIAETIAAMPGVSVDLDTVGTNLVYASLEPGMDGELIAAAMARDGVRISAWRTGMRFALHYGIDDEGVERAIAAIGAAVGQGSGVAA